MGPQAAYEEWNEMKLFNKARERSGRIELPFFFFGCGLWAQSAIGNKPKEKTSRSSFRQQSQKAINQSQRENKEKAPRSLVCLLVGYGRWPSCSAPIPLIFSFPIQRLISCCSPHASLLPLFFGAQPKKKSWNEDKLRQLNNKWKRGMIWRKWKQRREWSWVDWIENI